MNLQFNIPSNPTNSTTNSEKPTTKGTEHFHKLLLDLFLSLSFPFPSLEVGSMDHKSYVCSLPSILMVVIIILIGFASADLDKDREQCTDQLVGLATCLPYVGGDSKAPTLDCCTGLKLVLQKSKICLCILIKDRNDPQLGLKINATIALGLPAKCNSPANINDCPSLLKLAPGSPDAKVFEDFANRLKGNGTITTPTGKGNNATSDGSSTAAIKSDSGRGRKWLGVEMAFGLLIFVSSHIFSYL